MSLSKIESKCPCCGQTLVGEYDICLVETEGRFFCLDGCLN